MFTRQWLVTVMSDVRYSRGNGLLILIRVTFGQLVRVYLLLAAKIYSCNNRLTRNNISIQGCCHNKTSKICMYTSFFKRQRQYDTFKAKEIINREILPQQTVSQIYMYTSFFKRGPG